MKKEKFRTVENVFDQSTLRGLFKLASQGYFEELKSPLSVGKESNVFSARTKDNKEVCIKIYRINAADFHQMYRYLKADPRYNWLQQQKRKIITTWAKREFRNLHRAREFHIRVPKPIALYSNILVMEMIGSPAQKLKNAPPKDPKAFYKLAKKEIENLYNKAQIIHADLSEYNILNDNEKPVLIDLSHGIRPDYPNAEELLERDKSTIDKYFKKKGVSITKWNLHTT